MTSRISKLEEGGRVIYPRIKCVIAHTQVHLITFVRIPDVSGRYLTVQVEVLNNMIGKDKDQVIQESLCEFNEQVHRIIYELSGMPLYEIKSLAKGFVNYDDEDPFTTEENRIRYFRDEIYATI